MKKVLTAVIIAAIIIGGAVTYTETHKDKVISTPVVQASTQLSSKNNFGDKSINKSSDNSQSALPMTDYLGNWKSNKFIGSINGAEPIGQSSRVEVTMNSNTFELHDYFSNNHVNHVVINEPVYKIIKLPDNYFHITFNTEPEKIGLASTNNYQILANDTPTDIYISNGHLVYNSAGYFFSLEKTN